MARRGRKSMSQINVVPFIDVMLVLLIIFMVTAPLLVRSVDVQLPISQGDPSRMAEIVAPIAVGIDAENRYFIYNDAGEQEFAETEAVLIARAYEIDQLTPPDQPKRDVRVYSDKSVDYDRILRLLAGLQGFVSGPDRPVKLMTLGGD